MRATTGVGSLPHTDPVRAASFVLETASVPYLPQLPRRHTEEGMIRQWGDGLCGCGAEGDSPGLVADSPPGPREEALGGAAVMLDTMDPAAPLVKTQATGPVTLAAALHAAGHRGGWECVVAGLTERIAVHCSEIAAALPEAEIVLVLDEPALAVVDVAPEAIEALGSVLEAAPVPAGVHCCGDADWTPVAAFDPAVISLDAGAIGPAFVDSATAVAAALSRGTRIVWGAVPTDPPPLPSLEQLAARVRRAEGVLVMAGADIRMLDGAWLSPACGLAAATEEWAAQVAARLGDLAEELA
jgi:methionine synthase II (cobalamin-independent)